MHEGRDKINSKEKNGINPAVCSAMLYDHLAPDDSIEYLSIVLNFRVIRIIYSSLQ